MPATSASTCSQTGAEKKLRKGVISGVIIGGSIGAKEDEGEERYWVIATVESSRGELSLMFFKLRLRHFESGSPQALTKTVARRSIRMAQ